MLSAPWTEIGRLQQEVTTLQNEMRNKSDSHEIHSINRRLDSLEHTCREIWSKVDDLSSRLQTMEEIEKQRELNNPS